MEILYCNYTHREFTSTSISYAESIKMTGDNPEVVMKSRWQIDKRVSISTIVLFIISFVANMCIGSWVLSGIVNKFDSRIATLETESVLNKLSRDKVISLDSEITNIKQTLGDIRTMDLPRLQQTLDHMIWDKPQRPEK